MRSTAKDVTTYIQESPAGRQETLSHLRNLCCAIRYSKPERIDFDMVEKMNQPDRYVKALRLPEPVPIDCTSKRSMP